jgi:hypothetical protein
LAEILLRIVVLALFAKDLNWNLWEESCLCHNTFYNTSCQNICAATQTLHLSHNGSCCNLQQAHLSSIYIYIYIYTYIHTYIYTYIS